VPAETFLPVSLEAECRYMKANELAKLLASLRDDRLEVVVCDDCCDPKRPYDDERVIHIQRSVAARARTGIERMLTIKQTRPIAPRATRPPCNYELSQGRCRPCARRCRSTARR